MTTTAHPELEGIGRYEYGWADSDSAGATARRGLSEEVVRDISAKKDEPEWMLKLRLKALRLFDRKPMPSWGSDLSGIHFDTIKYFVRSTEKQAASWEDLPEEIKNTYDRLGIPEAEKQRLVAGVAAQYESEVVYHQINEELEKQGVIFVDTDTGLREYPELFQEYFGTGHPRWATTSSPRSTRRCGRAARSSTCPRACTSRSRCRPTSASTPRTWASSSGR
jgi:Fe-S cluster assembly protein SufB